LAKRSVTAYAHGLSSFIGAPPKAPSPKPMLSIVALDARRG